MSTLACTRSFWFARYPHSSRAIARSWSGATNPASFRVLRKSRSNSACQPGRPARRISSSLQPTRGLRSTPINAISSSGLTSAASSAIKSRVSRASRKLRPPLTRNGIFKRSSARSNGSVEASVRTRMTQSLSFPPRGNPFEDASRRPDPPPLPHRARPLPPAARPPDRQAASKSRFGEERPMFDARLAARDLQDGIENFRPAAVILIQLVNGQSRAAQLAAIVLQRPCDRRGGIRKSIG